MKDMMDELAATTRETGTGRTPAGEGRRVVLRRTYPAGIADVWDAITTAERISRWFLPIEGDLRLGGRYQLEGNAGGEVLACEPPHLLRISWVMGEPAPESFSEVEVRLSTVDGGTLFELEHTATVPPQMWDQFGPGAVGVGWDGALLGLALHLASPGAEVSTEDKMAFLMSDEMRGYLAACSQAWGEAYRASGANPEAVRASVAATTAFYVPPAQ
ncbi:MAG: SRPBCC family protein [Micromonosporaceae bacterium]|nr:SRPBCC family protein [Micromonosporaceae bacterium]